MISVVVGYRMEGWSGTSDKPLDRDQILMATQIPDCSKDVEELLQYMDFNNYIYYKDVFYPQNHANFLGMDGDRGALSLSLLRDDEKTQWRIILRAAEGVKRLFISCSEVSKSWWRSLLGLDPSYYDVIKSLKQPTLPLKNLKQITDNRMPSALLNLEERQTIKGFKLGLLYAKEGQLKEEEIYSNVDPSPEYDEFLDFLGDRITLQEWPHFRAGLDTQTGTTGKQSLYASWNNVEVMWHVATMLPHSVKDKQQLERKRHIGNDIVVLIFQDGDSTPFKPQVISSRQILRPVKIPDSNERFYRLTVIAKDGVPSFGPPIPNDGLFAKSKEFKNFLYTKLLNAEKASYEAPILGNKLSRTRAALLQDVVQTFL